MTERVAGYFEVSANGRGFNATGSFTLDEGAPSKPAVLNSKGKVVGYAEEYRAPSIKGAIVKSSSLNLKRDLLDMDDATVTVIGADGTNYLLEGAWHSGAGELDLQTSQVQAEISARSCTEI